MLDFIKKRNDKFAAMKGIGDVIALVAKPIARASDTMLGTSLTNCRGCEKRKESLNQAIPFKPKELHE